MACQHTDHVACRMLHLDHIPTTISYQYCKHFKNANKVLMKNGLLDIRGNCGEPGSTEAKPARVSLFCDQWSVMTMMIANFYTNLTKISFTKPFTYTVLHVNVLFP